MLLWSCVCECDKRHINEVDEISVLNWDTMWNEYVSHEPAGKKEDKRQCRQANQCHDIASFSHSDDLFNIQSVKAIYQE